MLEFSMPIEIYDLTGFPFGEQLVLGGLVPACLANLLRAPSRRVVVVQVDGRNTMRGDQKQANELIRM